MKILNLIKKHYKLLLFILMCIIKNDYLTIGVMAILIGKAAVWALKASAEIEEGKYEFR